MIFDLQQSGFLTLIQTDHPSKYIESSSVCFRARLTMVVEMFRAGYDSFNQHCWQSSMQGTMFKKYFYRICRNLFILVCYIYVFCSIPKKKTSKSKTIRFSAFFRVTNCPLHQAKCAQCFQCSRCACECISVVKNMRHGVQGLRTARIAGLKIHRGFYL